MATHFFRFFFYFLSEIVLLTLTTKAPNDDQNIEKTIFFNRNKSNQCEICSATPILNSFFQNRIITLKSNFPKAKSYTCVCSVQFCFFLFGMYWVNWCRATLRLYTGKIVAVDCKRVKNEEDRKVTTSHTDTHVTRKINQFNCNFAMPSLVIYIFCSQNGFSRW